MKDPIEEASTVAEMMAALNEAYHLELPESFPKGTQLGTLWEEQIKVTGRPSLSELKDLYKAIGTSPVKITVPEAMKNIVSIEVEEPS
ncbi:MAG TPA: hypothetical protein VFX44_06605 [Solirubrobacterales bacterium]|nr:hypothetical protein [Solirubrobacterales bacterium]